MLPLEKIKIHFYAGIKLSLTSGLLVWGVRASGFLMTLFSALPIFRGLDPLPVISSETRTSQQDAQAKDKLKEDSHRKEVGYLFDSKES